MGVRTGRYALIVEDLVVKFVGVRTLIFGLLGQHLTPRSLNRLKKVPELISLVPRTSLLTCNKVDVSSSVGYPASNVECRIERPIKLWINIRIESVPNVTGISYRS